MSAIFDAIGLGGGSPRVNSYASQDVTTDSEKSKKLRAALTQTAGGVSGEELLSGTTSKRGTLLGN